MQYTKLLIFCFLSAFILLGCSSSDDDGGDTPNQPQSCIDASGYWVITHTLGQNTCDDMDPFGAAETSYKVTQTGCSITVYNTAGKFDGNINGSAITWSGKFYSGPISTTFTSNVNSGGGNFAGNSSWTLSDGYGSCTGSSQITGTIYNKQD